MLEVKPGDVVTIEVEALRTPSGPVRKLSAKYRGYTIVVCHEDIKSVRSRPPRTGDRVQMIAGYYRDLKGEIKAQEDDVCWVKLDIAVSGTKCVTQPMCYVERIP